MYFKEEKDLSISALLTEMHKEILYKKILIILQK